MQQHGQFPSVTLGPQSTCPHCGMSVTWKFFPNPLNKQNQPNRLFQKWLFSCEKSQYNNGCGYKFVKTDVTPPDENTIHELHSKTDRVVSQPVHVPNANFNKRQAVEPPAQDCIVDVPEEELQAMPNSVTPRLLEGKSIRSEIQKVLDIVKSIEMKLEAYYQDLHLAISRVNNVGAEFRNSSSLGIQYPVAPAKTQSEETNLIENGLFREGFEAPV